MSLCGVCHMCAPCMQDKYRIVFNMQDKNVKKLVNVVDKQHNYIAINFPKAAYQHYYCLVCFVCCFLYVPLENIISLIWI